MADIRPFCAIRPKACYADRIAALPYDVYTRQEAKEEVLRNPLSFLGIDRAESWFADTVDQYDSCVYKKAGSLLRQQIEEGYYLKDESPSYYIYELTWQGKVQTGVGALFAVDDFLTQQVRPHEATRRVKETDRIRHVAACNAQTGPVFLMHRSNAGLKQTIAACKTAFSPIYDVQGEDGVRHRLWRIAEEKWLSALSQGFAQVERLYIADGHHRCQAAVQTALARRRENPCYSGKEPWNYVLSVIFGADELSLLSYNRAVQDLNGLSERAFLAQIHEHFHLEYRGGQAAVPAKKGEFGMCLKHGWYLLTLREEYRQTEAARDLDAALLQQYILEPVLGIKDPRTDQRLRFIGGDGGAEVLEQCVRQEQAAAFLLYPTSLSELFAVSDAGGLMPPKSTWFAPKLRSGFLLHSLAEA